MKREILFKAKRVDNGVYEIDSGRREEILSILKGEE